MCTPIIIIGDEIRESSEVFQVVFTAADDNDEVPAVFRITIADDGDGNQLIHIIDSNDSYLSYFLNNSFSDLS